METAIRTQFTIDDNFGFCKIPANFPEENILKNPPLPWLGDNEENLLL